MKATATDKEMRAFVSRIERTGQVREGLLNALAGSIKTAHRVNPASWSLSTRLRQMLRLNVGRIMVLDLQPGRTRVTLALPKLSTSMAETLEREKTGQRRRAWSSAPDVTWYEFTNEVFVRLANELLPAHEAAIERVGATIERSPVFRAHAPEFVEFVSGELNAPLPQPKYIDGLTESIVDELVDLVNRRFESWEGFADSRFVDDEVTYKQTASTKARELLAEAELRRLIDSGDHEEIHHRLTTVARASNLLYLAMPKQGDLALINQDNIDAADLSKAVFDLLHGDGDGVDRLQRFVGWADDHRLPNKWTLPTYYLFLLDPSNEMFVKPGVMSGFLRLVGRPESYRGAPTAEKYELLLDLCRELTQALERYGPSDMIDIQSFVWVATQEAEERRKRTSRPAGSITDGQIRELAEGFDEYIRGNDEYSGWEADLLSMFEWIRSTPPAERATEAFQKKLWDDNAISAIGQGSISVDTAIADSSFRQWVAGLPDRELSSDPEVRVEELSRIFEECVAKLRPHTRRMPRLKVFRVLAALFPEDFTTAADRTKCSALAKALTGSKLVDVPAHAAIRARLDDVLGPAPDDDIGRVRRLMFAWRVYQHMTSANKAHSPETARVPTEPGAPDDSGIRPLPAGRRQRGMSAPRGLFDGAIRALDFVGEGVTAEELTSYFEEETPDAKPNTLRHNIRVLHRELQLVTREGDRYKLSAVGADVLRTGIAAPLVPRILGEVLGPDHVLVALRDSSPLDREALHDLLLEVNSGWKTHAQPTAILRWLKSFDWISGGEEGIELTDEGRRIAGMIHWEPEKLDDEEPENGEGDPPVIEAPPEWSGDLPSFTEILSRVERHGHFEESTVQLLHAGLWAHPRRHFAVFTGLSGSGKTMLARAYAQALTQASGYPETHDHYLQTLPIQPGWSDPASLLGYASPLRPDTYLRTATLEFLLRCAGDPTRAYTLVLDEMNLSHPEQYLAPILSAMETGSWIELHQSDEFCAGVPARIRYPANLVLIGTVNMDETTHGLSDKILDRAVTVEFWDIRLEDYPRRGTRDLSRENEDKVFRVLTDLMAALRPARLHFGWRVVDDVLDFLAQATGDTGMPFLDAFDRIVYSKVLPKLRGDDAKRFRDALDACGKALAQHNLAESSRKVQELSADLEETGAARFWR